MIDQFVRRVRLGAEEVAALQPEHGIRQGSADPPRQVRNSGGVERALGQRLVPLEIEVDGTVAGQHERLEIPDRVEAIEPTDRSSRGHDDAGLQRRGQQRERRHGVGCDRAVRCQQRAVEI